MRRAGAVALLLGLTWLTYAGAARAAFVYDDRAVILNNSRVTQPQPAWSYWTTPELIGGQDLRGFRPLTMLSFAWNYRLAGPSRPVFHLTSVGLHGLAVIGLWLLCRRLLSWAPGTSNGTADAAAFAAAALFATHPALSQSVVYLTARSTLISATAILFAAVFYDSYLQVNYEGKKAPARYVAALGCWLLALSGKESALAGAALFAGIEWWRAPRPLTRATVAGWSRRLGPVAAVGVAYLVWVFTVVRAQATTPPARTWTANLVGQCAAAWEYARLLVWPRGLAIVHGAGALAERWTTQATLGVMVVAAMLGVAWWCRRRQPAAAFGLLGALVVIGPESYAVPLKILINEHRLYLPAACLAVALAAALVPLLRRGRRATVVVLVLAIGGAATATTLRLRDWRSPEQVWADAWAKYPTGCRAPAHLGQLALEAGGIPAAVRFLEAATTCNPVRLEPRLLLVQAYAHAGRPAEAIALAEAVRRDFPRSSAAYEGLATALARADRVAEAIPLWERALELDPRNSAARWNLEQAQSQGF